MFNFLKRRKEYEYKADYKIIKELIQQLKLNDVANYNLKITKLGNYKYEVEKEEIKEVKLSDCKWETSFSNKSIFYI